MASDICLDKSRSLFNLNFLLCARGRVSCNVIVLLFLNLSEYFFTYGCVSLWIYFLTLSWFVLSFLKCEFPFLGISFAFILTFFCFYSLFVYVINFISCLKKNTHILHINLFVSVLIYTLQRYYFIIISFSKCLFCKAYAVNAKC